VFITQSAQGGALLTLTRKIGESIRIGDNIVVIVKEIKGKQVRLGIEAPRDIYVCREELFQKIEEANRSALFTSQTPNTAEDPLAALGNLLLSKQKDSQMTRQSPSRKSEGGNNEN
jgi:carbon storage regulator